MASKINFTTSPTATKLKYETCTKNVTLRNKTKLPTNNTSLEVTAVLSDKDEYESLASTSSTINDLNQSYPDLYFRPNDDVKELQNKISLLEEKLLIAETEIENLILENSSQLKQINDYKLKIDKLTHICTSTKQKTSSAKIKRKNLVRTKLNFKNVQQSPDDESVIKMPSVSNTIEEDPNVAYNEPPLQVTTEHHYTTEQRDTLDKQSPCDSSIIEHNSRKLCLISDNNVNNILGIAETTFPAAKICHYCMPKAGIVELLETLEIKLINYSLHDYCIIFIGEQDFLVSNKYDELVNHIRYKLENIKHTNVILCSPNFKLKWNVNLFNTRIEAFNRLLYLSNQTYKYTYTFDTNRHLEYTHEMFSKYTGKVKNKAILNIFHELKSYIKLFQYENNNCNDLNVIHSHECSTMSHLKPGTIPYYFKKMVNSAKTNKSSDKPQLDSSFSLVTQAVESVATSSIFFRE